MLDYLDDLFDDNFDQEEAECPYVYGEIEAINAWHNQL